MSDFYPPLPEKEMRLIQTLSASNPEYFNHPDCPYAQDTKDLFMGETQVKYFDKPETSATRIASDDQIAEEINDVYSKLKDYWSEVKSSDKSADKNTFFRVSTSLLDKLVELRERMSKIKKVNSFIGETLSILDEILTPDQRNEVMDRLKKYSDSEAI